MRKARLNLGSSSLQTNLTVELCAGWALEQEFIPL